MTYIEKFNQLFKQISNHPSFETKEIKKLTENERWNQLALIELKNEKGYSFHTSFLDAISISRAQCHFRFWYDYKKENVEERKGGGEFKLISLDTVLVYSKTVE